MSSSNIRRADKIDVSVTDERDLPDGWEKTHEESRRPVMDLSGYYIHTYESEHFLVSQDVDKRNGETVHYVTLLKVKRGEDGERLTALGTGIYHIVGVKDGFQTFEGDAEGFDSKFEKNKHAHKEAEKAAFQLAVDLMREVNAGKYEDKRYSE